MKERNKRWLRAAAVRAVKTFAQTAAAALGVAGTAGHADLAGAMYTALIAGALSILTSLAGLPEVREGEDEK